MVSRRLNLSSGVSASHSAVLFSYIFSLGLKFYIDRFVAMQSFSLSCLENIMGVMDPPSDVKLTSFEGPVSLWSNKPEYDRRQHERYVKWLEDALYVQGCRNVALSGSYGSGKSSILEEFVRRAKGHGHRLAKVSLATFTPSESCGTKSDDSITSKIEREILGQLIYQGRPSKAVRSSFNQVHRKPMLSRALDVATIVFTIVFLVAGVACTSDSAKKSLPFLVNDLQVRLSNASISIEVAAIVCTICLLAVLSLLVLGWFSIVKGSHLKSVTGPSVSFSVDKDKDGDSYFNKYRDELIYVFEENHFDTVVFEDIDRFDVPRIFDELRNLNNILNLAPGIVGNRATRSVRFVYAVRDSIFASLGEGDGFSEVVTGSKRSKFFDMVISVIPFLSEFNAKEMSAKIFEEQILAAGKTEDGYRFNELLRLASPYIADMRLLVNIRNDFIVMADVMGRPTFGKKSNLGLTCTGLLAISILKNLDPLEYENLRIGKGKLNELYDLYQQGIKSQVDQLSAAREICLKCQGLDRVPGDISKELGDTLKNSLVDRIQAIGFITIGERAYSITDNSDNNIYLPEFWEAFFKLDSNDILYLGIHRIYSNNDPTIKYTKKEFINQFCSDLPDVGISSLIVRGTGSMGLSDLDLRIEQFRSGDFNSAKNLMCLVRKPDKEPELQKFEIAVEESFGDGLIKRMILEGFINKDFNLYISQYPSNAKPGAVNFVAHCYRRGQQDLEFRLSDDECADILNVIPTSDLNRSCCLNFDLFVFALGMNGNLKASSKLTDGLIEDYVNSGKKLLYRLLASYNVDDSRIVTLVGLLMSQTDHALDYLLDGLTAISDFESQCGLMRTAFKHICDRSSYSAEVNSCWLETHVEDMGLENIEGGSKWSDAAASYLDERSIVIHDLSNIGQVLGRAVVDRGAYIVSRENLLFACGTEHVPTLDTLEEVYGSVNHKVLSDAESLQAYLDAMSSDEYTMEQFPSFVFMGLCKAVDEWSNSADVNSLAELIVTKMHPKAELIELNDLCPVGALDCINVMGIALIRALVKRKFVSKTCQNAFYLFKLSECGNGDVEGFAYLVDSNWFKDNKTLADMSLDDLRYLAKTIVFSDGISPTEKLLILKKIRDVSDEVFPVNVDSESLLKFEEAFEALVSLYEQGLIQPGTLIYKYLAESDWEYRERVLFKWLIDHPISDFNDLPHFLPQDLPRIVSSDILKDSWLAKDIIDDIQYYLNNFCDEDIRGKVASEIQKVAEGDSE